MEGWWPPGHVLGWEHGFVNQWRAFLQAYIEGRAVDDRQADFLDGALVESVGDALTQAACEGRRVEVALPEDFQ
jgi:predicted dehydrogenase